MLPPGPKIALTGGLDFNDHHLIWDRLDKVHAKHPDMVLIHGGSRKGAELIASKWATNRKVPQIAFKPDWTKHAKAAPFKRNDAMLELLPIGVMHFPGTGSRTTSPTRRSASASAFRKPGNGRRASAARYVEYDAFTKRAEAVSKTGNGDQSAAPFNVAFYLNSDRAALLHCVFMPET